MSVTQQETDCDISFVLGSMEMLSWEGICGVSPSAVTTSSKIIKEECGVLYRTDVIQRQFKRGHMCRNDRVSQPVR